MLPAVWVWCKNAAFVFSQLCSHTWSQSLIYLKLDTLWKHSGQYLAGELAHLQMQHSAHAR